jgi:hypothetical protein
MALLIKRKEQLCSQLKLIKNKITLVEKLIKETANGRFLSES